MMRITQVCSSEAVIHFRIEGRLGERVFVELKAAVGRLDPGDRTLLLDLRGVSFATAEAVDQLLDLRRSGAVLIGCSSFLAEMLQRVSADGGEGARANREWASRLRAGDESAFREVVETHGARLLATARRLLRDEDEARDAVQDALLSAFKGIDGFNAEAQLSTWLHRIVINAALMRLRRSRRRAEQSLDDLLPTFLDDGHWETQPNPSTLPSDELVEREQTRHLVRRCIERLPEAYRRVLILRDIEDLDTEETARLLGDTANAVKVRLHRARQALRTLIERELGAGKPPRPQGIEEAETSEAHE